METKKCFGNSWPSRYCDRPAIEEVDGHWYCKPHAAGRRRSQTNAAKQIDAYKARQERDSHLRAQADRLSTALGTRVELNHLNSPSAYSDTKMVVPIEWLERLAARVPA